MEKKSKLPVLIAVIFVLVWITILAVLMPYECLKLGNGAVYELNDGWSYIDLEGTSCTITLPTDLHTTPDEPCTITRVLDKDFPEGMTLLIRGSLQSVKVTLDGQILLYAEEPHKGVFYTPMASAWYLVNLPADSEGKTLSITFNSPFAAFSGTFNEIVYGNGADVMYSILAEHYPEFFIITLIALVGILMMLVSLIFHQLGDRTLLFLGLFAIALSGWFFAESRMIQFFTGNRFLIGGLAYMMIALFPIPFFCYLRESVIPKYKYLLRAFCVLFGIDFLAVTILQLFGITGFFITATVTNIMLACCIVTLVVILFIEIFRRDNKNAKRFLIYSGLLIICAGIELTKFFTQSFNGLSYASLIGMLIFIILLGIDGGIKLKGMVQKHSEAVFFEKMAYHDILTGANNRTAFERDIENLVEESVDQNVRLVLFDVNDLKYINDTFGHAEGDEALRRAYLAMEQAFRHAEYCYRIGGDEFAVILNGCDSDAYEEMRNEFIRLIREENRHLKYTFSVAVGSATYEEANIDDFRELLKLTDQMMYLNKSKIKQENTEQNDES